MAEAFGGPVGSDLPAPRAGRPPPEDLLTRRAAGAAMGGQRRAPGIESATARLGGVACVVCTPPEPRGTLVHLHGGGFRQGSAAAWTPFGTRLAAASAMTVVLPDYGLAPEAPFPAGLRDALSVLAQVQGRDGRERVLLSGDSAGGGLAFSAALVAAARGAPVGGVALLSPWLDLANEADSFLTRAATDTLFSKAAADEAAEGYLQGVRPDDPLVSPLLGDLALAPPALVLVSADEVLLDDSLRLAQGLAAARRPVQLEVVPGQPHVWPVVRPDEAASERALRAIAAFAAACLAD
jgi:epsilon-lactone hydrolase